jgi:hypothetical protein
MIIQKLSGGKEPNKQFLSDKNMSSCLLQKAQKPRQHIFAPEHGRYAVSRVEQ